MADHGESDDFFGFDEAGRTALEDDLGKLLGRRAAAAALVAETVSEIVSLYSEKHRAYHNLSHVAALLGGVEKYARYLLDAESVRLAVWFHDAVYRPERTDNEAESARLAVSKLEALNFPPSPVAKVERMIAATARHDAAGLDADGRLFLDLDLAILGAPGTIYRNYARAIRREYAFVPEALYREKRREILKGFLNRPQLYETERLRELCEVRARANIENEIKELS